MVKRFLITIILLIAFFFSLFLISYKKSFTGYQVSSGFYITLDSIGFMIFGGIIVLSVLMGKFKRDIFIFTSGAILGFLVEWYGISREIWSYPHGQQLPPLLMILAWGVVTLSSYHLSLILRTATKKLLKIIKKSKEKG